jgi:hypothetical protein
LLPDLHPVPGRRLASVILPEPEHGRVGQAFQLHIKSGSKSSGGAAALEGGGVRLSAFAAPGMGQRSAC